MGWGYRTRVPPPLDAVRSTLESLWWSRARAPCPALLLLPSQSSEQPCEGERGHVTRPQSHRVSGKERSFSCHLTPHPLTSLVSLGTHSGASLRQSLWFSNWLSVSIYTVPGASQGVTWRPQSLKAGVVVLANMRCTLELSPLRNPGEELPSPSLSLFICKVGVLG